MKLHLLAFLSTFFMLLCLSAALPVPKKSVLISFPNSTPNHVLEQTKKMIEEGGGIITHEYRFIKAFAVTASTKALDLVSTAFTGDFKPTIEEDQEITIADG